MSWRGAAAILLLGLLAASCGQVAREGPVEIRYWTGWTGHELDVQRSLIREFNRTHPHIRVKILCVAGSYQKVPIAIAGGDTPDVCSAVWSDQLYGYASRGALEPLDKYLQESGRSIDEWMPGVRRMLQYGGRTFGLNATANASFIVYNKEIFRECGLDPEKPPLTLSELETAAEKTTKRDRRGNYERYGLRPGGLQLWSYVFGGRWYDAATGELTADDPGNVAALRWLQSWFRKYDVRKMESFEAGFGSVEASTGAFYTGKTAMWQTGEWAGDNIKRYAPNLQWGYTPLPSPAGGRKNCVQLGGSIFVMPSACKNKKEAFEFLSWICGPYASRKFCREINNIPPLISAAKAPEFQRIPLMRDAIKLAGGENAFGPSPIPIWSAYQREIQRAEDRAIHSSTDAEVILRRVQKEMARALEEARHYAVY